MEKITYLEQFKLEIQKLIYENIANEYPFPD